MLKQLVNNGLRCLSTIENPPGIKKAPELSIPQGILGQATCHTHPHLIGPDQIINWLTQTEFRERRETFVNKLVAEVENINKTHIVSLFLFSYFLTVALALHNIYLTTFRMLKF